MPKFADVFDRAAAMAKDIEAYEALRLVVAEEPHRPCLVTSMKPGELRAYDELMRTAYFQQEAADLKAQQIAQGR